MIAAIYYDGALIYGLGPVRRITNLPRGVVKLRIRQRADELTRVFLRFVDRIERWELKPDGPDWALDFCSARNYTR